MPRYLGDDQIQFEDFEGNIHTLIEPQEIPSGEVLFGILEPGEEPRELTIIREMAIKDKDDMDELAQRRVVYGPNSEDQWYFLFDANVADIVDNGFSTVGLQKLKIPNR